VAKQVISGSNRIRKKQPKEGDMKRIKESAFFCSWSGGKDSCLALYHVGMSMKLHFLLFSGNVRIME
jgi:hypothetical protein